MIRWPRERWGFLALLAAGFLLFVTLGAIVGMGMAVRPVLEIAPPLADEPERLILPTIEHGLSGAHYWPVRWINADGTEHQQVCYTREAVEAVEAFLGGDRQ